jgi:sugar phosphate isomerase/epimerase
MHSSTTRRRFLSLVGSAAAVAGASLFTKAARAVEPIKRRGTARFPLSVAAYSFRNFFTAKDPAKKITLFDFIDFCADQGCQGAELTSYYFPANADHEYLLKLKRHAFLRGIEISGTAVGNNFGLPKGEERDNNISLVKKWVDNSAVLGAPHIRVFASSKRMDAAQKELCIATLEECAEYAATKGIFLGVENHGGVVETAELLEIVKTVKNPWLGVNLDTGNFATDDPYEDIQKCAPYAVNVQWKVEIHPRGKAKEPADLARIVKILREANYQGYLALEYESADDPWKEVPAWLGKMRKLVG